MVFASYEDQMHLQKQPLIVKAQELNCHHDNCVQGHHQVQHYLPLCQLNHLKNYQNSLSTPGRFAEQFYLLNYLLQKDEAA
jgi:hypothetical protein